MIEEVTDKDMQIALINYLNDAFDLHSQNEAFAADDKILEVYKNDMGDKRSFMIHFIHRGKMPLVGIFFEWTEKGDINPFGRNRLMWVSAEMAQIISRMKIGTVNALFGKKKEA